MKKIAAVIIVSIVLILSAGCIAEKDAVIGTWESVEPYQSGDTAHNLVFTFSEDYTGKFVDTDLSEGQTGTFPALWIKTGDKTYLFEEYETFKISDDGKTLTSNYGYTYTGGDGFTKGTWVQNGVKGDAYRYEYVFNPDGTGVETYYEDETVRTTNLKWNEDSKNLYELTHVYSVKFSEDGKTMYDIWGDACEESNGVWTNIRQDDWNYYYTYEFIDDDLCKLICYYNDTEEVYGVYYYVWKDSETAGGRTLDRVYLTYFELQSDGTLKDRDSSLVLKKVSASSASGRAMIFPFPELTDK
ncbi:MAG: hypothetical protein Q4Q53_02260 [Methanocorpusculum sp.]|nr:hypothetical protein [Methanocorpusculum sp.]